MGEDLDKTGRTAESEAESPPERDPKRERAAGRGRRGFALWAIAPVAVFAVLAALTLTTGKPSASQLMSDASTSFSQVGRGDFSFEIAIAPSGSETALASSIKLSGPFELIPGKPLPKAEINYTISSGERSQTVHLVTTGDNAYTILRGQAYELPEESVKQLKQATSELSKDSKGETAGLSGLKLNFDRWLVDPVVKGGGEVNGTPVWSTKAGVDVVAALQDLAASAGALSGVTGTDVPKLSEKEIKQLKDNFSNARVELLVGRYDDIVRKIDLSMDFNAPEGFGAATGGISGGKLNVTIGIDNPNQPVDVQAPKNVLPFESLQSLSEGSQSGTALDDGVGK